MSKLPNEIRLEIVRKLTANVWKIEELLKTIKSEIKARETSEAIKAQEVQGRKHNHGLRKFPPTANALVSIQGKDFQLQCVYCSGEHYSASCTKAQLPKDRKEILQRANRCFICLKTSHGANSCFKITKCRNCDGKHHQSICLELNTNSPRDKNRPPSSTSGEQNDKDTENNGVTTATSNFENTNSKRRVLSQTHSILIIDCLNSLFQPSDDDILANSLKGFWETESIDINDLTADGDSKNESFEIDVNRNGDRYEVKLPWKGDCCTSSNGYQLCASRLRSLHHKLRKQPSLLSEYSNIIQEQLKTGIVEEVPAGDLKNKAASQSYYLPHLAVVRTERETTKVRVVYDGSAKASKEEKSLNDCLQTGPNYLPHVFDMLANFRKSIVGLTADIEKAFLKVGIQDDKRDFLRFL